MAEKVGMISLGCPKNQVDAELMLAKLEAAGFELVNEAEGADVVIVNTCGFIEDAKREAIENILEMAQLKQAGMIRALVVTGCLAERYREEVLREMPEIDVLLGIGANGDIVQACRDAIAKKLGCRFGEKTKMPLEGDRLLTTPSYWAYLKVADGCSNCCAYCAIPQIRGPFRSRTMESLVHEARALSQSGVKELILIAQDTTRYGEDLYGRPMLPALLNALCEIEGIEWLRLLYCYPDRITEELLDVMAAQEKVIPYIDLPLQHADASILRAMNRTGSRESLTALLRKIRARVPDVVIRTTFITGFPGEDERAFETLSAFVQEMEFDRLGCFAYSPEEGTPAAQMAGQVDEAVKKHRGELIMEQQYDIFDRKNRQRVGKMYRVLTEGVDQESGLYEGRTYMDAPEIDGRVLFSSDTPLAAGTFANVRITGTEAYDLLGETIR